MELTLLIIGMFALIIGIIFGYAMTHEYRAYLENHHEDSFSLLDFIKRERFYIYLFLASTVIMVTNLLYFLQ